MLSLSGEAANEELSEQAWMERALSSFTWRQKQEPPLQGKEQWGISLVGLLAAIVLWLNELKAKSLLWQQRSPLL